MSARPVARATRRSTRSPQPHTPSYKLPTPAKTKPLTGPRRPLPRSDANTLLKDTKSRHSVKTQELKLNAKTSILIARMKVPTPPGIPGHLIKRFDTDAISASTFFRVAFPTSSPDAEEDEMQYLRSIYDCVTAGNEDKNPDLRLTGTWIPTSQAISLAETYGIYKYAAELIAFENPFTAPNQDVPYPEVDVEKPSAVSTSSSSATASMTRSNARNATSPALVETPRTTKRARMTSPRIAKKSTASNSFTMPIEETVTNIPVPALSGVAAAADMIEQDAVTVTVTSVSHDPKTGDMIETTTAASFVGTDDQVAAARDEARELVASLKDAAARVAASDPTTSFTHGGVGGRKRACEGEDELYDSSAAEEDQEHQQQHKRGLLRRMWRRRHDATKKAKSLSVARAHPNPSDRVSPETRRSIAFVGLAVAGVAASVLPYIFY